MNESISEITNRIQDQKTRRAVKAAFDKVVLDSGNNKAEILTAAKQLTKEDNGKTFYLNSATEFTVTLPAVATAGLGWCCEFIVMAAPSGAAYVITELASSDTNVIIANGINELEVDTSDDGPYGATITTISFADGVAVAGDWVRIRSNGATFFATGQTNADGGIAVA